MFIGRESELQFLEDKYKEENGQLIVLYGRRRIGKTETLHQFCKDKPHVFYSCIQTSDQGQLQKFSTELLKEDIPARKYISTFPNWSDAFLSILDLPTDQKKLVVIDEFPYMVRANKSIPSILQNIWDTYFKEENIMLILCGSAMSFIEKEILAEKNPLYGRATGIYKMKEMGFYEACRFFENYSDEDKILAYSILGGVPHYLKQWNPKMSVAENIQKNILTKGCILYSEVDFLLHQELRETSIYNSIIESIALGNTKLNEISTNSLINDTAKTSVYLKNLMELGIIERAFSVDTSIKERGNKGRWQYHLNDHFFRFWYTFGFSNFSQLEDGDAAGVYKYVIEPNLHAFASFTFEEVCQEFLRKKQKNNELPFRYAKIGKWFGKTTIRDTSSKNNVRVDETEIDVMAISANRKNYLIGECKYKASPFRYSDYLNVKAKLQDLQKSASFYYALFSQNGFDEKIRQEAKEQNISLYSLEEVVNYKE
jgi:AAA+ ATPase superfamily predicted ATPase